MSSISKLLPFMASDPYVDYYTALGLPNTKKELEEARRAEPVRTEPKIGRNDPCPCGSVIKYKKCCGK